ncbi:hypothetical protein NQD34_011122 [Periophthalmus magnuspinnatus]|nr:hypothetical protein NQD34_011122 [Periophthalmus magnuspinnatus]
MTTRSEREKAQKLNEQHQAILSKLLREEDNKYCADCEAKGPRWASWNLGVFMCIRCAGIHRNLGVHISRVKSVNLDQWTPEQIQSMVEMGNNRAKLVYEAHLPESFRRPQSDQAVEVFIRDKYERKRYFDKDALPPQKSEVTASPSSQDKSKPEKEKKKEEKKREKETERHNPKSESRSPKKSPEPNVDLLGLDGPDSSNGRGSSPAEPITNEVDLFGPMVSNPLPSSSTQPSQAGGGTAPPTSPAPVSSSTSAAPRPEEKKLMSKDSILSLYSSQPAGVPQQQTATGQVYMGQPQMPFPSGGGAGAVPNGGYMQPGVLATGQNPYGAQSGPQPWGVNQMTQQMSSVAVSGPGPSPGGVAQPGAPSVGYPSAATASGQTLSTQLWK